MTFADDLRWIASDAKASPACLRNSVVRQFLNVGDYPACVRFVVLASLWPVKTGQGDPHGIEVPVWPDCLLYTSDAADE